MSGIVGYDGLIHELLLTVVTVGLDMFARKVDMEVSRLGQSFY